jgi:hypothetical protein
MAGETLHSDITTTFDFLYADLQRLMVVMENPSGEWKMIASPGYKMMKQHDKVSHLL